MTDGKQQHWDDVYDSRADDETSWFQAQPTTSVRLVALATRGRPGASVIDVGAGTSTLVDALLETRHEVTVLDVSGEALAKVARRLGARADDAHRIQTDLLSWQPDRTYDVWHDRAAFHFLTTAQDLKAYVELVAAAVAPGGAVVLGAFAADGPTSCSGLPTSRYDADTLAAHFHPTFTLEHQERELHNTPTGAAQAFTWIVLRRR